ncbi:MULTISPECIES: carboxypeptidase-like regulatory domain-containing protein [Cellulomonas]|uniref:Alpha-amylase n=1 Tax=Cellulomonas uda TaxID=1714 RepID=A0A4Y3KCI4_CELUD|nr:MULTISPECIES: carboxypeptidase-like regulatory domain-containing protein [Cellulomonas]ASR55887.1 hypothetical protein CBP52_13145 [Cellulomonas sp. PSBB021]NII66488.1 hypothetical protein [Cellulomonas uda]GEA81693.1 hypothetical protein CUD01_21370 [Cellulomonas uda]
MFSRFAVIGTLALALVAGSLAPATAATTTVTYTGRVTAAGKALPKPVHVRWYEPATGLNASTLTRADGTYSLLVPGRVSQWVLVANPYEAERSYYDNYQDLRTFAPQYVGADGATDHAWEGLELRPAPTEDATVDIDLVPAGTVVGTVTGGGEGTEVFLERADGGRTFVDGKRVRDGSYVFRFLIPGRYRILVHRGGTWTPVHTTTVTVLGGDEIPVRTDLRAGGTVTGRLLRSGRPVAGVEVTLAGTYFARRLTSDAQGRYRADDVPPGTYRISESGDENGWTSGSGLLKVTSNATTTRDLTLVREGRLTVDAGGQDVALADADGTWRRWLFSDHSLTLPPGQYLVWTKAKSGWSRTAVTIRSGKLTQTGKLRADHPFVTVRGKITGGGASTTSRPKTVRVCDLMCDVPPTGFTPAPVSVAADGTFVATSVIPGAVSVTASQKGWQPVTKKTVTGGSSTRVDVRLTTQGGALRVKLVTPNGVPLTGWVSLTSDTVTESFWLENGSIDTWDGRIAPGTYRITSDRILGSRGAATPFWLDVPGTFTVRPGERLDLGTVRTVLQR